MVKAIGKFKKPKLASVPDYLVYEMMRGKPVYYKDYEKILSKQTAFQDIMGSSGLQSLILSIIEDFIKDTFKKKYRLLISELGLHIGHKENYSADIAGYDREKVTAKMLAQPNYLTIPPTFVVEVDIKADISELKDFYFLGKTQDLLNWGVEEVIWVFTTSKKIILARQSQPWMTYDWSNDLLFLGEHFNLKTLAAAEDLDIDNLIFDNL
jgi:Uma2 family endonuclease